MAQYREVVLSLFELKLQRAVKDFFEACDSPGFLKDKEERLDGLRAIKKAHSILYDTLKEADKVLAEKNKILFEGGVRSVN
jgi:hypothetical protein